MNSIFLPTPNDFVKWISAKIPKHIKFTFICAVIIGFIVHMYSITHLLPNHDAINHFDMTNADLTTSGRWFYYYVIRFITGNYYLPWLDGCVGIFLISLSACLTVSILKIKTYLCCFITALLMMSFPVVASFYAYTFAIPANFASMLFACLGVYLTLKYKYGCFISAAVFMLSLAVYQAFICYALGLFVCFLILNILDKPLDQRTMFFYILKILISVALGFLLYRISTGIALAYKGVELTAYQGLDQMGNIDFINGVNDASAAFDDFFFNSNPNFSQTTSNFYKILTVAAVFMLIYLIIQKKLYKKNSLFNFIILLLLILSLRVSLNTIYIFTSVPSNTSVHTLMIYSLIIFPIFIAALVERFATVNNVKNRMANIKNIIGYICCALLLATSWQYVIATNQLYTRFSLVWNQIDAYAFNLINEIQKVGNLENSGIINIYGEIGLEFADDPLGDDVQSVGFTTAANMLNHRLYPLLKNYLGYPVKRVNIIDEFEINQYPELKDMPLYPAEGSIIMNGNGEIVIKAQELNETE